MRPIILIAFLAAGLVAAGPAFAGTYDVSTCDSGSVSGWSPTFYGHYNGYGDGCRSRGALSLHNRYGNPGWSEWRFSAPPDTDIAAFRLYRRYRLAAGRPWGAMAYKVETFGSGERYRREVPNFTAGPLAAGYGWEGATDLDGQTALTVRLECGGGNPCTAPAGEVELRAARMTLRDTRPPVVTAVTGALARPGAVRGRASLAYAAEDRGGGLRRAELRIDGAVAAARPVHGNDGRCTPPFRHVVPCRLAASGTLEIDTARIADGPHALELRVVDATGTNAAVWRRTIAVANRDGRPGPASGGAQPGSAGGPQPGSAGGPVSASPRFHVSAWLERGRRRRARLLVPHGTRVRVRGRVTDREGRPVAGAALRLREGIGAGRWSAGRRWSAATGVVSRADGRFTAFTRVGPSRRLRVVAPDGTRGPLLRLGVRAPITVRSLTVASAATLVARGRLGGGHVPRAGALVELQTRTRGRWSTRRVVRTRRSGRFAARLRGSWRVLRARVPLQPGLPYAAGVSPPRTARRTGAGTSR
jgi:hypothetical protein